MSVIIKNMEMPKSCFTCPISHHAYSLFYQLCCGITGKITAYPSCEQKRMDDCPLIPVPPHGDLIDRDALEKEVQKRLLMCNKNDNQFQKPHEVMRAIVLAPAIIPADREEEEMK